ncbi:tRNA 2-selenouridine(34) synthase MnmH [Aeromonas simiae]|uniref:tRNA 2-selenouridine(34) synthase MnmH n=1 Tax=Aeromonas simiae TaxID=218936 RepID=UPI00266BF86A|nr:tRNA 2-selenouridine(34) synthase MnmH [Aeromonas simiae]MDO2947680.1 tRNA 2-selenouridine(34) synthase MnmH [Aeromonas simiae]MDO2952300.1 tRNA 2-selenouridine(34) synthase MnmH [Aeromonas simiae]MDO2954895.1 tRNA 2-selenouridine(34) synthase MnmH [Aeromonas simiae]
MDNQEFVSDIAALFLGDVPLIDLRAPVEFAEGAFPLAISLPLMSDDERAQVGTCYKEQGQEAAIRLGHSLVCGEVKAARMAAWQAQIEAHPESVLYCFRGGLRSQTVQQWLREAGLNRPRVAGGYKALRQFLIQTQEQSAREDGWTVLTGMTGSGKTHLLHKVDKAIDLEGHAHHRGSSFGRLPEGQPSTINFENGLAIEILKRRAAGQHHFVVEDESHLIGRCALPLPLFDRMCEAPVVVLEVEQAERARQIRDDYVIDLAARYRAFYGDELGWQHFTTALLESLERLKRRLGDLGWRELDHLMRQALDEQARGSDCESHLAWITAMLDRYYDPMYRYQLERKQDRIVFRGDRRACLDYLNQLPAVAAS